MLLWALLASGQIQMRKVDGWETLSQPLESIPLDLLKAKYAARREAGKPAKVAIVTLMPKLVETANALVKAERRWTPKTA